MRSSLAALAVAVAAATLAGGCGGGGGGGGDDEKAGGGTSTTTTTREAVDVSTPVAALADAGISCDDLVSEGTEGLALFDIEGTESNCTIGGDPLWAAGSSR